MFTGIIQSIGKVEKLQQEGSNLHITIDSPLSTELKIDQSVAHNGVCLTVVEIEEHGYTVTAIDETLQITNLSTLTEGALVNLELAMKNEMRLDGHLVQGHVDQTAVCKQIEQKDGSWEFIFEFDQYPKFLLVNKGSVCIDGVSLTVVNAVQNRFSVAIIPYTFEHTIFKNYKIGSVVNIEFDIIGKYVQRHMEHYKNSLQ
ncbi:MAG: riboflavin synthase [Chitinophagales bacterium]